jgi:hypothetical protein
MDAGVQEGRRFSFRLRYESARRHLRDVLDRTDCAITNAIGRRFAYRKRALLAITLVVKAAFGLVRLLVLAIDLWARWLGNVLDAVTGDRGWLTVGSAIGAYLVVYGLVDARHQREVNQAVQERNTFVSLVSAGNAASFVGALKTFGAVQRMRAVAEPSLFKPWAWNKKFAPNRAFMWQWARSRFPLCTPGVCSLSNDWRIDLSHADLQDAFLANVDLHKADLSRANLRGTDLTGSDLRGANLFSFSGRVSIRMATNELGPGYLADDKVEYALYDENTKFPDEFDPQNAVMSLEPENSAHPNEPQ